MRNFIGSWKEIAAYLGKSIRTAQRWERELGLPVRRPSPNCKVVLARFDELDEWVHSDAKSAQQTKLDQLRQQVQLLERENERLRRQLESMTNPTNVHRPKRQIAARHHDACL